MDENEDDELVKYNIVLNGDFVYDHEKQILGLFDCNMTRYYFSLKMYDGESRLRYMQQSAWEDMSASVYFSSKKSKFICLNESYQESVAEMIKWRTVKKQKINLWVFMQIAKQEGHKDLLKFVDFYKACTFLK